MKKYYGKIVTISVCMMNTVRPQFYEPFVGQSWKVLRNKYFSDLNPGKILNKVFFLNEYEKIIRRDGRKFQIISSNV